MSKNVFGDNLLEAMKENVKEVPPKPSERDVAEKIAKTTRSFFSLSKYEEALAERKRCEEMLEILTSCWDHITPLECMAPGFSDRVFEDRNKRVVAFKEALARIKALKEKR